jgi:excisionase family DNA binding protein
MAEVMKLKEVAEYLGVSTDTLYSHLREWGIPAFKLGNNWRFKKTLLDQWMEEQSQPKNGHKSAGQLVGRNS